MPHFHFHVALRGDLFEDRDGCTYHDLGSAQSYGRRLALDLRRTGTFTGATVLMIDAFGQEVARFAVDNVVVFPHDRYARDADSETRRAHPDRFRADIPRGWG